MRYELLSSHGYISLCNVQLGRRCYKTRWRNPRILYYSKQGLQNKLVHLFEVLSNLTSSFAYFIECVEYESLYINAVPYYTTIFIR